MLKLTTLFFLLFSFALRSQVLVLPNIHEEIPCFGLGQVEAWRKDFSIDLASFPAGNYYCDNAHPLKKIFNIFHYLQRQKFLDTDVQGSFKKGFVRSDYWSFVKERVKKITYNNSTEIYYMATNDQTGDLQIYPGLFIIPLVGQVASIIHEARHFEGFHHLECVDGIYKGKLACDQKYELGGTYAVELEYALRVFYKGANFSLDAKDIMKNKLVPLRRDNNFIEKPLDELLLNSL